MKRYRGLVPCIVRSKSDGQRFIESSPKHWEMDYDCYMNEGGPAPMPEGHRMFKRPEEYGCEIVQRKATLWEE